LDKHDSLIEILGFVKTACHSHGIIEEAMKYIEEVIRDIEEIVKDTRAYSSGWLCGSSGTV
jgi:hypothetical protein